MGISINNVSSNFGYLDPLPSYYRQIFSLENCSKIPFITPSLLHKGDGVYGWSLANFLFSIIVLGDHKVGENPDCQVFSHASQKHHCAAPNIKKKITKTTVHENYNPDDKISKYDIALIRLDSPIPLHSEDPKYSSVLPIILPWSPDNFVRDLKEGDSTLGEVI